MAGPVNVTRLAELTVMDRTTLTRNLELLQKQGLIDVAAGGDRRTRIVTITVQGNTALAEALPLWKKAQSHVVKALGQDRWAAMLTNLTRHGRIGANALNFSTCTVRQLSAQTREQFRVVAPIAEHPR
jgi:DNA-binding MarR family transcriptional regulator